MTKETGRLEVKQGFSQAKNTAQAAREFIEQVDQPEAAVVVFFASSNFDLKSSGFFCHVAFLLLVILCFFKMFCFIMSL